MICELEIANGILANSAFTLQYEPYGNSLLRNPDFLVSAVGLTSFNLEVKRIREASETNRLNEFLNTFIQEMKKVPSGLGFSIEFVNGHEPVAFVNHLREATPSLVEQCIHFVEVCKRDLSDVDSEALTVGGLLRFTVHKLTGRPPNEPTANLGGAIPVLYEQSEYRKFGDRLIECLGQMRPGMANVLAVRISSCTHEPEDLGIAIGELCRLVKSRTDEFFRSKGIENAAEFVRQMNAFSGVLVKSWGAVIPTGLRRNRFWCNPGAEVPLSSGVVGHLIGI